MSAQRALDQRVGVESEDEFYGSDARGGRGARPHRDATVMRSAKHDPARHAQQIASCLSRESSVLVAADQIVLRKVTPVFAVASTTGSGGDSILLQAGADKPFGEIEAFADLSTGQTLVVVSRP